MLRELQETQINNLMKSRKLSKNKMKSSTKFETVKENQTNSNPRTEEHSN